MYEKVNPAHPDKIADRIAGALTDIAYKIQDNPKIATEVLLGHGVCHIIAETSVAFDETSVKSVVDRIAGDCELDFKQIPQDIYLANNQKGKLRCGDNGIFKGVPITREQKELSLIARDIYSHYPSDGKYILDGQRLIICQSHCSALSLKSFYEKYYLATVNPLGDWTGGPDVDCGCTNRKLGSDLGDGVTGGGLHGKDLSKGDVSITIYAHLKASDLNRPVEIVCAIGDEFVDGKPYEEITDIARAYITSLGGFEKLAEWGLI